MEAASLRIEGTTDGLREEQIQFICDVLAQRGFKNNRVIIEPVGKSGDNYVACVSRITTIIEGGEDFNMIGKFAPENEAVRQAMNIPHLFNNETVMYKEVLPKLVAFQTAAGVPERDLLRYAKCYGSLSSQPNEVILLEDLKELNYYMLDRFTFLNDDIVKKILKNFAVLHSLSYALKKEEPESYDEIKTKLFDVWSNTQKVDEFQYYADKLEEDAIAIMNDDDYKNALRGIISQMPAIVRTLLNNETDSKYFVILQGDGWTNNFMFNLVDDVPSPCIMIDYQLSREASPVSDILYMIFNCTDHETRTKYYNDWINFYHDQLDKALSTFGMEAKYIYPKDQLDADLKSYSQMYFGISVMLHSVLCRTPEEASVIKESLKEEDIKVAQSKGGLQSLGSDTVKLYKARVEGLVDSYRLFGYL